MPNASKKKGRRRFNPKLESIKAGKLLLADANARRKAKIEKVQGSWKFGHMTADQVLSGSDKKMMRTENKVRAFHRLGDDNDRENPLFKSQYNDDPDLNNFQAEQVDLHQRTVMNNFLEIDPSDSELEENDRVLRNIQDDDDIFALRRKRERDEEDPDMMESSEDDHHGSANDLLVHQTDDEDLSVDDLIHDEMQAVQEAEAEAKGREREKLAAQRAELEAKLREKEEAEDYLMRQEAEKELDSDEVDEFMEFKRKEREKLKKKLNKLPKKSPTENKNFLKKEIETQLMKGKDDDTAKRLLISKKFNESYQAVQRRIKEKESKDDSDDSLYYKSSSSESEDPADKVIEIVDDPIQRRDPELEEAMAEDGRNLLSQRDVAGASRSRWGKKKNAYYGADTVVDEEMIVDPGKQALREEEAIAMQMQREFVQSQTEYMYQDPEMELLMAEEHESYVQQKADIARKLESKRDQQQKVAVKESELQMKAKLAEPSLYTVKKTGYMTAPSAVTKTAEEHDLDPHSELLTPVTHRGEGYGDDGYGHGHGYGDGYQGGDYYDPSGGAGNGDAVSFGPQSDGINRDAAMYSAKKSGYMTAPTIVERTNETADDETDGNVVVERISKRIIDEDADHEMMKRKKKLKETEKLIKRDHPELPGMLKELKKCTEEMKRVFAVRQRAIEKRYDDAIEDATLFVEVLRTYSAMICFYLRLKAQRADSRQMKKQGIFGTLLALKKKVNQFRHTYRWAEEALNELPPDWSRKEHLKQKRELLKYQQQRQQEIAAQREMTKENKAKEKEKERKRAMREAKKEKAIRKKMLQEGYWRLEASDRQWGGEETTRRLIGRKIYRSQGLMRYRKRLIPKVAMRIKHHNMMKLWKLQGGKKFKGKLPNGRMEYNINHKRTLSKRLP